MQGYSKSDAGASKFRVKKVKRYAVVETVSITCSWVEDNFGCVSEIGFVDVGVQVCKVTIHAFVVCLVFVFRSLGEMNVGRRVAGG